MISADHNPTYISRGGRQLASLVYWKMVSPVAVSVNHPLNQINQVGASLHHPGMPKAAAEFHWNGAPHGPTIRFFTPNAEKGKEFSHQAILLERVPFPGWRTTGIGSWISTRMWPAVQIYPMWKLCSKPFFGMWNIWKLGDFEYIYIILYNANTGLITPPHQVGR